MLAELIGKQENSRVQAETTMVHFAARVPRAEPHGSIWLGRRGIWLGRRGIWVLDACAADAIRVPGCCVPLVSGRCTCMGCVLASVAATCARARAIASVSMGCAWRCVVGRVEPVCSSSLCDGRRARSGDGGAGCFEGNLGVT